MFSSRKNKAINSYLVALPKMMTNDYGKSSEYTALQVIKSIERHKFIAKYKAYAVVLHCSKEEYFSYFIDEISKPEYQKIRNDISNKHFDGLGFTSADVAKYSLKFSNYGGDTSVIDWFEGGSDGDSD